MKIFSILTVAGIISGALGVIIDTIPCLWPANTSGNTSAEFAAQTGITSYDLHVIQGKTFKLTVVGSGEYIAEIRSPEGVILSVLLRDLVAIFEAIFPTVISITVYDPLP